MRYAIAACMIILAMLATVLARKLTVVGALCGGIVATFIFMASGFTGLAMLGAFFVAASMATSVRKNQKQKEGLAEAENGKRNAAQVFANGGIAAIVSAIAIVFPHWELPLQLMAAGALSSAAADTVSSEIGNAFGSKFFNVLTLRKDAKGLDGVISAEGTIAGLLASMLIAVIYSIGFGRPWAGVFIVVAGTAGNFLDSMLGASLERRGYLGNNAVNFLNTLFAALVTWTLYWLHSSHR